MKASLWMKSLTLSSASNPTVFTTRILHNDRRTEMYGGFLFVAGTFAKSCQNIGFYLQPRILAKSRRI